MLNVIIIIIIMGTIRIREKQMHRNNICLNGGRIQHEYNKEYNAYVNVR